MTSVLWLKRSFVSSKGFAAVRVLMAVPMDACMEDVLKGDLLWFRGAFVC